MCELDFERFAAVTQIGLTLVRCVTHTAWYKYSGYIIYIEVCAM